MNPFFDLSSEEQEELSLWNAKQVFEFAYARGIDRGYDEGYGDGYLDGRTEQ